MAMHYVEFDTTQQALVADLRREILLSNDWQRLGADTPILTTTVATAVNGTTLTFASTSVTGLAVGSMIAIDTGVNREYRTVTAMTATTLTVAAMSFAHAIGAEIRFGNEIFKATTARGADMIVDLNDSWVGHNGLALANYRSHDGVIGVDKLTRYLYYKQASMSPSNPLHVVLSVGKEWFFLMIEGPRANEAGAQNTNYGSLRRYFFMSDLEPYHANDTVPVIIVGGAESSNTTDSGTAQNSGLAHCLRNSFNTGSWQPTRTISPAQQDVNFSHQFNVQRNCIWDGTYTLLPYLCFLDDGGMRGRLSHFFHAGNTFGDYPDLPAPPVGAKVQYQGQWYKLHAVNKSDGANARHIWGPFGAANNAAGGVQTRSVVIAVPCLP